MRHLIKHVHLTKGQPCKAKEIHDEADEAFLEPHRHEYWEILWCLMILAVKALILLSMTTRTIVFSLSLLARFMTLLIWERMYVCWYFLRVF